MVCGRHVAAVASSFFSQLESSWFVEFACSPPVCVGVLWVPWHPDMQVRLIGDSKIARRCECECE